MLTAHAFAPTNRSVKKQLLAAYFALSLVALKLGRALMFILTVLSISMSSAFAETKFTRLSVLLKQGFEIRATYYDRDGQKYLILQKGASAYECSSYHYGNTYRCIEIFDAQDGHFKYE